VLRATGLVKRFGGVTAINGVDLRVAEGEVVGLIGPNGAGKTTLVDLLTGHQQPTSGRIDYMGRDVTASPPEVRNRLGLARTFQITRPFLSMTVFDNVMVGALFGRERYRRSLGAARDEACRVLDRVGLADVAGLRASALTAAGRKRLEIARCLATSPRLVFLDEPLAGLNPREVEGALEMIRDIRRAGVAIVFIEHIVSAVTAVSDRVLVLANGVKLADGPPSEVLARQEVQRVYLGDVRGAAARVAGRRA
jgi:branched-chain amino acid transport system ATP-binding protein